MNFYKILAEIEQLDPEVYERLNPRRRIFKHFAGFGKTLSAAALPLALGTMFNKAYGQTTTALSQAILDVLTFAHNSEYIGMFLYDNALKQSGFVPSENVASVTLMRNDEMGHIQFLKDTAKAFGITTLPNLTADMFDYSGAKGGAVAAPFPTVYSDFAVFLGVAQGIEDNDVRAYKGGAPVLMPNNTLLDGALSIHSVEARHSSHVRTLRRGIANVSDPNNLQMKPKSWISGNDGGGPKPPVTTPIYAGEENTSQANVDILTLSSSNPKSAAASEAFDEPLTLAAAKTNARNFVKPPFDQQYFS